MARQKLQQFILISTSIVCMLVASVSACACSHHGDIGEVPADAASSCHSSSHETPAAVADGVPSQPLAGADCDCFVRTPLRAITGKSGSKKFALADADSDDIAKFENCDPSLSLVASFSPQAHGPTVSPYSGHYRALPPSRAPPRL